MFYVQDAGKKPLPDKKVNGGESAFFDTARKANRDCNKP
ncbi:hypothetical protein NY78_2933 [Desulfovibrio sp. TomC]|nr:hypothetical protein NY78_2933 [Desulfovibrio sp. TomC]